jgi:hypothetical protein
MWVRDFISVEEEIGTDQGKSFFEFAVSFVPSTLPITKKKSSRVKPKELSIEHHEVLEAFVRMSIVEFLQNPELTHQLDSSEYYKDFYIVVAQNILRGHGYTVQQYPIMIAPVSRLTFEYSFCLRSHAWLRMTQFSFIHS